MSPLLGEQEISSGHLKHQGHLLKHIEVGKNRGSFLMFYQFIKGHRVLCRQILARSPLPNTLTKWQSGFNPKGPQNTSGSEKPPHRHQTAI